MTLDLTMRYFICLTLLTSCVFRTTKASWKTAPWAYSGLVKTLYLMNRPTRLNHGSLSKQNSPKNNKPMQYEVTIDDSGLTKQRNDIITSLDNHIKGEFLCIFRIFFWF